MTTPRDPIYTGHRYPAEIISYAVWLYFRFPLSLRMVEEMLAARGISVTHETIRQWNLKFGREFANRAVAWTDHIIASSEGLLFTEVDSWMTGINRNVEGKQVRRIMRYSG